MKVMVAAGNGEGSRNDDFNHCMPGELVRFPVTCDCPDCGCDRAMAGLASSKATTVFKVQDHQSMTVEQYRAALLDALEREGWLKGGSTDVLRDIYAWADEHLSEAARFETGDLLALVGGVVMRR